MINFRNSPFLWVALMLLISYWISAGLNVFIDTLFRISLVLTGVAGGCLALLKYQPTYQYTSTLYIGILIVAAGFFRLDQYARENYRGAKFEEAKYCDGIFIVRQVLKNKGTSLSINGRILFLYDLRANLPIDTFDKNVLISVKTASPLLVFPGDTLLIQGWKSAIPKPLNPHAFDARKYYNSLTIRHQINCKAENLSIKEATTFSIRRITAKWQWLLSSSVKEKISPQVAQLTNALVWGDRSDMDSEVRDAFADSGAMHVLSVSGMHVAIIYSLLLLVLGPPGAGNFISRVVRFSCYSMAIILYMALTGACPAVVRASLMILLYLFGKSMAWNTQVWNLLGFAAFVMMWINPFAWENIGFQLSFLAMAGILLFAKPIIRSLSFRWRILHLCWEITALSIAAQIFILPILLSQFHQFPLTFILSSLVAMPAAYIVMFGALLNIILSFIGIDILWSALDWSGKIFIGIMKWMSGLNPLMHFSLTQTGTVLLMLMAIFFSVAIVFGWHSGKRIAWLCGIITFISLGCHRMQQWSTKELIVYHSYSGLLFDVFDRGKCYSLIDCSISPERIDYATRGNRCRMDVIGIAYYCLNDVFENELLRYDNSKLELHGEKTIHIWNKDSLEIMGSTDLLFMIFDECPDSDEQLASLLSSANITFVLPAHLNRFCKESLKKFLQEHNRTIYDIDVEGYYRVKL